MTWGSSKGDHTVERAGFARGMRRMGFFVPHWDFSRPSSSAEGWMDYGRPLEYKAFEVSVKPADGTRKIDGETARHYVLKADFTNRSKGDSAWLHTTIDADLWVLADKPFSWAAFSTAGIYGDPRLDAAMSEQLADLGMVVRVATRYRRQPISPTGKKLGSGRDGSYLTWISDIQRAQVPDVHLPTVSYQTTRELQHAMWADGDGHCKTLLAGGTPDFVKKKLTDAQQAVYVAHMRASCERRAKRKQRH
jgi:hypothetical protein